jgi:hypothetical protein
VGRGRPNLGYNFRLKVAGTKTVEAALAQPKGVAQHFLEHFPFEAADRAIRFRELEIGARVKFQDGSRMAFAPRDLGFDSTIVQDRTELNQAIFPGFAPNLGSIEVGKPIGNPDEKQTTKLPISNFVHQLGPKRDSQVGIVLSKPAMGFDARLIEMPRPSAFSRRRLPFDHPAAHQSSEAIANRGRRDPQLKYHLINAERASSPDQIQQGTIG